MSKLWILSVIKSAISSPTPSIPKAVNKLLNDRFLESSIFVNSLFILISPNPSNSINSFLFCSKLYISSKVLINPSLYKIEQIFEPKPSISIHFFEEKYCSNLSNLFGQDELTHLTETSFGSDNSLLLQGSGQ